MSGLRSSQGVREAHGLHQVDVDLALGVVVLMRDVVSLLRKFRASRAFSEESLSAPSLTALETEVE
jgi:hypothetical protein